MSLKTAVCLVAYSEDGKILTATRRNSDLLALPGGKVDAGETCEQAIVRETREETGFILHPWYLIPVHSEVILGEDGNHFYCITYLYTIKFHNCPIEWEIEKGIKVKFVAPNILISDGAFSDYNYSALLNASKAEIALGDSL